MSHADQMPTPMLIDLPRSECGFHGLTALKQRAPFQSEDSLSASFDVGERGRQAVEGDTAQVIATD